MELLKRNRFLGLAVIFVFCAALTPAQDVLDGIAATVDNRIILISEVESQLQLMALQAEVDLTDQTIADSLRRAILSQMIDDKLVLIEAGKDTSLKVTGKEVEEALNQHINRIKSQFPSEEVFLAQLSAEGLTLKELRSRYKDEVKNQLYKERFLNKKLTAVSISSGEVKEFYESYKDSLPSRPSGVHAAHILISINPGETTKDSLYRYAQLILQKVSAGEDFAILAKNFSDDGTAMEGGDLGWFSRGDMVGEFEDVAFALSPGEVSGIVETQFGYHIIKCTEKKDERIRASHILIKFEPTEEDVLRSKELADSLYQALQNGADFAAIAAEYSADETSAEQGGDLGWYAADELSTEFVDAIASLNPGEISEPVRSAYGYHLLKVIDKKISRPLDFNEDYSDIEAIAKRFKAQDDLEDWLKEIRGKYYIEVKI